MEFESGYARALKAAGFEVLDYAEFGTYQGDWIAFVRLNNQYFFIHDNYGSCSGCDAFNNEVRNETTASLKSFGEKYKDEVQTFEQMMKYANRHSDWDLETKQMIEFIESKRYTMDFDNLINSKDKKDSCV